VPGTHFFKLKLPLPAPCFRACHSASLRNVDSLVPNRLIRRFSQPCSSFGAAFRQSLTCIAPDAAPFGPTSGCSSFSPPMLSVLDLPHGLDSPSGLPSGSVDSRLPKASHPCGLPAAVSRATAQPPGSAHLPRCLVVYIRAI
jgi:hypothetical protein